MPMSLQGPRVPATNILELNDIDYRAQHLKAVTFERIAPSSIVVGQVYHFHEFLSLDFDAMCVENLSLRIVE